MRAIVAIDEQWGIGKEGKLLFTIPEDMKHFKDITINHIVVMGSNTFESLPGMKALPSRENIVLSSIKEYQNVINIKNFKASLDYLRDIPGEEIYIIGGGKVYLQFLPFVNKVKAIYHANTFFPNLDEKEEWKCISQSEWKESGGYQYCFCVYKKY